jgi:hypothetical protein
MSPGLKAKIEIAHASAGCCWSDGSRLKHMNSVHEDLDAMLRAACEEQRKLDASHVGIAHRASVMHSTLVLDDEAGR